MSGGSFDHNLAGIQHGQGVKWDANLCALVPADFEGAEVSHGQLRATAEGVSALEGSAVASAAGTLSATAEAESSLFGAVLVSGTLSAEAGAVAALSSAGLAGEQLADSPDFLYVSTDVSGSTANDQTGNGNDGTIVGASITGDGFTFDGTDDYLASIAVGDLADMTFECLITTPTASGNLNAIWGVHDSTSEHILIGHVLSDGTVRLRERDHTGSPRNVSSTTVVDDGALHHVVGTFDNDANMEIWIDGVSEGTNTTGAGASATWDLAATVLSWGARNKEGTHDWFGPHSLENIAFYPTILSDTRIQDHATAAGF